MKIINASFVYNTNTWYFTISKYEESAFCTFYILEKKFEQKVQIYFSLINKLEVLGFRIPKLRGKSSEYKSKLFF